MVSLNINDLFMLIFVRADTIVPCLILTPVSLHMLKRHWAHIPRTWCRFICCSFASSYYDCYSHAMCTCV